MQNYEQWTRDEIARLRAEADKATTDANTLQRTLDRWLATQASQTELPVTPREEGVSITNHVPHPIKRQAKKRTVHGNKNATALEVLTASPDGLTTDELYHLFAERFGTDYKRSSMRALLWHQKQTGKIDFRDGRYVVVQKEPNG